MLPKTESIGLDRGLRRPPLYGSQSGLLHVWAYGSLRPVALGGHAACGRPRACVRHSLFKCGSTL